MEALPLWFLLLVTLVATGVGARVRHGAAPGLLAIAVTLGGIATSLLALRVSPSAYEGALPTSALSLDWLAQIPRDLAHGSARLAYALGLLVLMVYVWWRGIRLGSLGGSYDRIYRVFRVGLATTVLALVVAAAVTGRARLTLDTQLALLLPLEVGIGLMALTLAHISDMVTQRAPSVTSASRSIADLGPLGQTRWLLTALGLAATIVIGALLLAVALSYNTLLALAQALAPVGDILGGVLHWLIGLVALVLFFLLNGVVQWIQEHLSGQSRQIQPPSPGSSSGTSHRTPPPPSSGIPVEWIVVGQVVVAILLVAAALVGAYLLLRALRRARMQPAEAGLEETRESLDIRRLLGAQLRALAPIRRAGQAARADENLSEASIRRRYREVLRAALRAGRGRRAAETPEEYFQRWAGTTPATASGARPTALARLTQAYERVRYGHIAERSADPDGMARAAAQQLIAELKRQRRDRSGPHRR